MTGRPLSRRRLPALLLSLIAGVAFAHDGHDHAEPAPAAVGVNPTPAGSAAPGPAPAIVVAKSLQHALAIRTALVGGLVPAAREVVAEALPEPSSNARLQAPEPGRVRATAAWPVAGQAVRAGDLLAVIEPALDQRERSQRRVQLATLEQKLGISQINVNRLKLQQRVNGVGAEGNTYIEQAIAEHDTLTRQIELLHQSLDGRVEIRATSAGRIQVVAAAPGQVVARGQALFDLAVARPRLTLRVVDAALLRAAREHELLASVVIDGHALDLRVAGWAPATPEPGWNLWLEFAAAAASPDDSDHDPGHDPAHDRDHERSDHRAAAPSTAAPELAAGQLVGVRLAPRAAAASAGAPLALPRASLLGDSAQAFVWLHRAPERFERRAVRLLSDPASGDDVLVAAGDLAPGDRIAVQGAALLDQFNVSSNPN